MDRRVRRRQLPKGIALVRGEGFVGFQPEIVQNSLSESLVCMVELMLRFLRLRRGLIQETKCRSCRKNSKTRSNNSNHQIFEQPAP
ncbi:hypothetical protein [Methylocella tundrae]|uniref:hypothetical protein n=1 Tax=Methylocella tundrae TaxID=227605 RepID=UPI00141A77AA|nr:hypothetical protein [Methylocella tundrae]